ncbi:hypothetical protein F5Y09DRAFT_311159 [Xylaria sp. FL1042]|nr:hypothetical protein F5Y09DRAFT_311159 [Xylaria sp. FL1042]
MFDGRDIDVLAVVIASGRLHTVEGRTRRESECCPATSGWRASEPTRIHHPGEVTGNPVLMGSSGAQVDLLVPSAEGGVFHFVRPASTPDERHMIAHMAFSHCLPAASCIVSNRSQSSWGCTKHFSAVIQTGGRLYHVTTNAGSKPWLGAYLKPIVAPGPLSD